MPEDFEKSQGSSRSRDDAYKAALAILDDLICQHPDYASARNNRAQLRRWRYGDRNTISQPKLRVDSDRRVAGLAIVRDLKLAIELARKFGGEIISADSMQVYRGLDIVTNKVTAEERQAARHHMIDFVEPTNHFSVFDFKNQSLDVISKLHSQKKLPIIVGGTHYYIESLLWKEFILPNEANSSDLSTVIDREKEYIRSHSDAVHTEEDLEDLDKFFDKKIYFRGLNNLDSLKVWKILEQVDREAAHLIHHNDKRKVTRMLQIYQANNRERNRTVILSELNHSSLDGKASLGGPLRFNPTCVIWLQTENEVSQEITDTRVDQMLERGLMSEMEEFHEAYNKKRSDETSYDSGIFQSIGFKEFKDYLMLDKETKKAPAGQILLEKCIRKMKTSTSQYAKRQLKWIRRRFLVKGTRDLPDLFKLTTAYNEEDWLSQVHNPAVGIVEKVIKGEKLSDDLLVYKQEPSGIIDESKPAKLHCEVCDRILIGSYAVENHLKSRNHQRSVANASSKRKDRESEDSRPSKSLAQ